MIMNKNENQFLWTEAYRPQTLDECVLPQAQLKTFKDFVKAGEVPNMIFSGPPGVGKTTVAKALCNELGCDSIIINGSEESGIDVLRGKIKQFASSMSFSGKTKVVILDEADYLNATSTQPALRGFMEEFSKSCRFIFTCNFKSKIIGALSNSRCVNVEFKLEKFDKPKMAAAFMARLKNILKNENVEYDEKVVAQLLMKYFPDYRRTLMELQRYSTSGVIDEGVLVQIQDINLKELMRSLKEKDFKVMRKWVTENIDTDSTALFRKLYDHALEYIKPQSVPNLILLLADYQYKSAFCADQEINTAACLTEMMVGLEYL